ncbi:MAG: YigZ family protein [Butyrivibrio sp.]|nr:YigZ family protein [Butyrivibrio sp.]
MSKRESYKIIKQEGVGEIVEKKSRFIGGAYFVDSAAAAEEKIAEISKKYWDARHNCYAYVIGENSETTKCSDNGEPSGTAGKPILEVINGSGITNILIIVTRYFGGVLLGTGGLVRAYTQAAQAAIAASEVGEMVYSQLLTLKVGYNMINNVQYYLGQNDITIQDSRYEADVQFDICVKDADLRKIKDGLTQKTEGQIEIVEGDKGYYIQ